MRNQYNILLGIALLTTIACCYIFNKSKYYSVKTGEEVKYELYDSMKGKDDFQYLIREETYLNYEAGFTAGMISLGLGFLFIGLSRKNRTA